MESSGRELLRARKVGTDHLPVGNPPAAWLRPAGSDTGDVERLTAWRNKHVTAFLTEFEATEEKTAAWLVDTVKTDDTRILFMLDLEAGDTVGYLGLAFIDWEARRGEADAIVRGVEAPGGLMTAALLELLAWALGPLELEELGVRVRSDNPALAFYEKVGFRETHRVPLRREERPDMVAWVEDAAASEDKLSLVHMAWTG